MPTNLRAQKKYERTGRVMRVADERVKKTCAWALLDEDEKKMILSLIRQRTNEHIDGIIDTIPLGHKLDYDALAEAAIRTALEENLKMFTPTMPDGTKADDYTVAELMEDAI